jgi:hypothetical protein
MMTLFAYIGMAVTGFLCYFVHEALKRIFKPYKTACMNVTDWFTMPYLLIKVFRYSDVDLSNVREYTNRAKQRYPIRFMGWFVNTLCKSRGL